MNEAHFLFQSPWRKNCRCILFTLKKAQKNPTEYRIEIFPEEYNKGLHSLRGAALQNQSGVLRRQ